MIIGGWRGVAVDFGQAKRVRGWIRPLVTRNGYPVGTVDVALDRWTAA